MVRSRGIIRVLPEDTLSSVLHLFSSTHDAAFVFDEGEFQGVIHPYHVRIKKSFPPQTKLKHALIHPPRLTLQHSIRDAARMMIESKIHYLPVFDRDSFKGIVAARDILRHILTTQQSDRITQLIHDKRPLHSVREADSIGHALGELKKHAISKLVVTDAQGKLTGVLSLYDLLDYLDNRAMHAKPVKAFQKVRVLTATIHDTIHDAIDLIVKNKIGSVIVIDSHNKPQAILTTKDFLAYFAHQSGKSLVTLRKKHISKLNLPFVEGFVASFNALLARTSRTSVPQPISKAEIAVEGKKKGDIFEAIVSLFRTDGKKWVFRSEDRSLRSAIHSVKYKAKRFLLEQK